MVEKSNFTEVEIWKHINDLRFKRIRAPEAQQVKCTSCNIEKLSHLLKTKNISDEVNEEFSKSNTKSLVEMFLALTEPPSYFERLYNKTIYGPQSRLILLASNIVNKSPTTFKLKAKHIFTKITSIVLNKYHYENLGNKTDISYQLLKIFLKRSVWLLI